MNQQKKVLGFMLKPEQKKALSLLCAKENGTFLEVPERDFWKTLGAAARLTGFPAKPQAQSSEEKGMALEPMLVFCGFGQDELFEFLAQYRQSGAKPVELKAMMTMHNIFWTPAMLQKELKEEQAAMAELGRK